MDIKNFRQSALKKISSPEELDQMVSITKLAYWWVLGSFIVFTVIALLWGFLGKIPFKINGVGYLISANTNDPKESTMEYLYSHGNGILYDFDIEVGDTVAKDSVIGKITQTDLNNQLNDLIMELNFLMKGDIKTKSILDSKYGSQKKSLSLQKDNIYIQIQSLTQKIEDTKELLASQENLYSLGLIIKSTVTETKEEIRDLELQLKEAENKLNDLDVQLDELLLSLEDSEESPSNNEEELRNKIAELEALIWQKEMVISKKGGIIQEVAIKEGDMADENTMICVIEDISKKPSLLLKLYVPFNTGEIIIVGQQVQIELSTATRDKYGFILGKVSAVNHFPSSISTIANVVRNDEIVDLIKSRGVVYCVDVKLETDPSVISGYKWSSKRSPHFPIRGGTICYGSIIVKEQAPISYIIPSLNDIIQ